MKRDPDAVPFNSELLYYPIPHQSILGSGVTLTDMADPAEGQCSFVVPFGDHGLRCVLDAGHEPDIHRDMYGTGHGKLSDLFRGEDS